MEQAALPEVHIEIRKVCVMEMRKVYWASVMAVVLGGAATVSASPGPAQRCLLGDYPTVAVSALKTEEDFGLGGYTVLKGAQFYVTARPGLTKEWLTLSVQREMARLQAGADQACRPNVSKVQVSVASAGGGFWVFLSAPDERQAKRLLNWAKTIQPSNQVAVQ
jgi:hypothetical protein